MSEITRRDVLSRLAMAFAAVGAIDQLAAQEAHHVIQQAVSGGTYAPKALSAQEFRTLQRLADIIVPVDNGKPGALQAGVPEWIDSLLNVNATLKGRYATGLAWLDTTMKTRGAADFVSATPAQQIALVDVIAYRKNASPAMNPGIEFFTLARRMTVDGFYTSEVGMRDIYPGNTPRAEFTVPQEAIDHVVKASPFR